MKIASKQILEAIKRGVDFALDDYDDEEQSAPVVASKEHIDFDSFTMLEHYVINFIMPKIYKLPNFKDFCRIIHLSNPADWKKNAEYYLSFFNSGALTDRDKDLIIKYVERHSPFYREYVDLDLPSGTLWLTENLGIAENSQAEVNGKQVSLADGDLYAWGNPNPNPPANSDETKKVYVKQFKSNYSVVDLELEDDPAYHENIHYRVPTLDQFDELVKHTIQIRLSGDEGLLFISKKNPFNIIHFPSASGGMYLTSQIKMEGNQYYLYFPSFSKNNDLSFKYRAITYLVWRNEKVPSIKGFLRPIYVQYK